ncbi:MAG: glycosyltransferase family 4 protein [Planctomycetia bacterium]|nr:glycosyltransferase family 4 protein [Planctomycetia bacterium]
MQRTLRIGVVTNYCLRQVGGAEEALDQLAALWHAAGHDVVMFSPAPRRSRATRPWQPAYPHLELPRPFSTRFGLSRQARIVRRQHEKQPFDVFLACDSYWAGYVAWLACRPSSAPYVVCSQGSDVMHGSRFLSRFLPQRRMQRVFREAAGVVCISRYMRERIYAVAEPTGSERMIPNGWPDEWSQLAAAAPVLRGRYVFSMGRIIESKGFQTLLTAYAQVRSAQPDVGLVIAGDGPFLPELIEQACRLGQQVQNGLPANGKAEGVAFPGFVHGETKRGLLQHAAIGVSPSLRQEPMSLTLFEMLSCGVPVIGSRVGGTPDIVEPGVNGELFAAGSADELAACLARVLGDGALRQRMAQKARPSVERFRWSSIAQDYLDLFREAISRRVTAAPGMPPQALWRNFLGWLAGRRQRAA